MTEGTEQNLDANANWFINIQLHWILGFILLHTMFGRDHIILFLDEDKAADYMLVAFMTLADPPTAPNTIDLLESVITPLDNIEPGRFKVARLTSFDENLPEGP